MNTIKVSYNIIVGQSDNGLFSVEEFDDFIFDKFKLVVNDCPEIGKATFEVEWIKKIWSLYFSIHYDDIDSCKYIFTSNGTFWDGSETILLKDDGNNFFEGENIIARDCVHLILFYMGYIMNYPRFHKQERRSSHKYSKEHRVSTSKNKIYLFDDILKYVSENYIPEKGHHNIQCECWEVRGHYRHYKSGKVVFVKSFKKGKNRATAEPKQKEYYV